MTKSMKLTRFCWISFSRVTVADVLSTVCFLELVRVERPTEEDSGSRAFALGFGAAATAAVSGSNVSLFRACAAAVTFSRRDFAF